VLDKVKLGRAPDNGQLRNYFYNVIAAGDCRDLFGVAEAFILRIIHRYHMVSSQSTLEAART
jgi:hypothetical protein